MAPKKAGKPIKLRRELRTRYKDYIALRTGDANMQERRDAVARVLTAVRKYLEAYDHAPNEEVADALKFLGTSSEQLIKMSKLATPGCVVYVEKPHFDIGGFLELNLQVLCEHMHKAFGVDNISYSKRNSQGQYLMGVAFNKP